MEYIIIGYTRYQVIDCKITESEKKFSNFITDTDILFTVFDKIELKVKPDQVVALERQELIDRIADRQLSSTISVNDHTESIFALRGSLWKINSTIPDSWGNLFIYAIGNCREEKESITPEDMEKYFNAERRNPT